jgi:hypothetical protein
MSLSIKFTNCSIQFGAFMSFDINEQGKASGFVCAPYQLLDKNTRVVIIQKGEHTPRSLVATVGTGKDARFAWVDNNWLNNKAGK